MISLTSPLRVAAHGWPAALKLGLLSLVTLGLASTAQLWVQCAALLVMLGLYAAPGWLFFTVGLRRLIILWPFVLGVMAWHIYIEDSLQGLVIVIRLVTVVGAANLVTMTTRLSDIMQVAGACTKPFARLGLNPRLLEICVMLVVRTIPVLAQKGRELTQSWAARSHRRAHWRIVLPLVAVALDDAEYVAEALRARGGLLAPQEED
ncbi:energy-coupling factor transporter transmembrane component T [Sinirhodobacter sp. HNIBRBA609]|nr:energy-coupling factor transporter transmembrane component T [Sinirhodobacter sp. HNIBRBA609]